MTALNELRHLALGLVNLGNTCYANAAVQCIAHCLPIARCILRWQPEGTDRRNSNTAAARAAGELRRLVAQLWVRRAPDPGMFTDAARELMGGGLGQQDAQELIVLLLAGLRDSLQGTERGAERGMFASTLDTVLLRGVRCGICKARAIQREASQVLFAQLPAPGISDAGVVLHIDACIARALAEEHIEGWRCDACKHVAGAGAPPAVKRARLMAPLPRALVVCVARGGAGEQKDVRRVACSDKLQLTASKGEVGNYRLQAVLCHSGSSVHGGHYYALCRHPETGAWLCYNDARVTPIAPPFDGAGCTGRDAYVAFYAAA